MFVAVFFFVCSCILSFSRIKISTIIHWNYCFELVRYLCTRAFKKSDRLAGMKGWTDL